MMNTAPTTVKRALLSVSDKTGIVEFAQRLHRCGVELISTGGTQRLIKEAGIPVQEVSEITGFPEMMDGRVKTLHPLVHGGILGLRDVHAEAAAAHHIPWIDLVVCNLYPFETTINTPGVALDQAIEQIDIGGPTMIRSAAKNLGWVSVVVNPQDYEIVARGLEENGSITYETRERLCAAAFRHTAQYDA